MMDKKQKSLVDNGEGDIILNESGTSVSLGNEMEGNINKNQSSSIEDDSKVEMGNRDEEKKES